MKRKKTKKENDIGVIVVHLSLTTYKTEILSWEMKHGMLSAKNGEKRLSNSKRIRFHATIIGLREPPVNCTNPRTLHKSYERLPRLWFAK